MYKQRRNGRNPPLYFEDLKFKYMPMNQLSWGSGSFPQSRETDAMKVPCSFMTPFLAQLSSSLFTTRHYIAWGSNSSVK